MGKVAMDGIIDNFNYFKDALPEATRTLIDLIIGSLGELNAAAGTMWHGETAGSRVARMINFAEEYHIYLPPDLICRALTERDGIVFPWDESYINVFLEKQAHSTSD